MRRSDGELGVGPINFGSKTDPPLENGFLSSGQATFLKVERVILALLFFTMFTLCVYNTYTYLYKARMFKSRPLVFAYLLILLSSISGIGYEFYMTFHCGQQDCYTHAVIAMMPEYELQYQNEPHKAILQQIKLMKMIREQLNWCFGMAQLLIIGTLMIKINSIEVTINQRGQAEQMRKRMSSADKRSSWLSIIIISFSFVFAVLDVILSSVCKQIGHEFYYEIYLFQLVITIIMLLIVLYHLYSKIRWFNQQSSNSLSRESSNLLRLVLI